jgi:hypothetical protein
MFARNETSTAFLPAAEDGARAEVAIGNPQLAWLCLLLNGLHYGALLSMAILTGQHVDDEIRVRVVHH